MGQLISYYVLKQMAECSLLVGQEGRMVDNPSYVVTSRLGVSFQLNFEDYIVAVVEGTD